MKHFSLAVLIVVFVISMFGCSKGSDSKVLAKVNSTKITMEDFKRQLEDLEPGAQQFVAGNPQARKDFLDQLVGYELALQEARRQGLDKDPEYKKILEKIKEDQEKFKKDMERRVQERKKLELLNSLFKKNIESKVTPPTDNEIKAYYNQHQNEIRTQDGRKLSLKEAAPQLKNGLYQKKRNEAFVEYVKELKAKAKVTIDEKALESVASSPAMPSGHPNLQMQQPAAKEEKK